MSSMSGAERALSAADEALGRLDVDGMVAHLSTAIQGFTAEGRPCQAAMACVRLGDVFANLMGNLTAARAWFTRAQRLVADQPPCLEQGWVAVAAMGCDVNDPDELLAAAELALDRARRFGDVNLETKALADAGLAHVQAGRIAEGMALLDEAMALACGPADDADTAARSVCSFFTACYFSTDLERADTWTGLLRGRGLIGLDPGGPVFLSSHCDRLQAKLLVELGRWGEAEAVLTRAQADFTAAMHTPAWHPELGLAELRVRQGRLADAEVLLLGKDQLLEALLPAARLHLARGDNALARAAAQRGLRSAGADRLRAVELLGVLVEAELAVGDLEAARSACEGMAERVDGLDVPSLRARAAAAQAQVLAASGDVDGAVAVVEPALDELDPGRLPWQRALLLLHLARLRESAGDLAAATLDAKAAVALLDGLDVALAPVDRAVLERLGLPADPSGPSPAAAPPATAVLAQDGGWWTASHEGVGVRLRDTKGLRYLAELVSNPGVERHALDLVDRVEGVTPGAVSRRGLGDAGSLLDTQARAAYRRRIEELRAEIEDAFAADQIEAAEARQAELDLLVQQLAQAFGLGGRARAAGSAAERARLNVTRALRAAIAKVGEALPGPGAVLDRRVRTGMYCAYDATPDDEVRWIVQS
jgi:tetratricopeptide (TPR) repeat protein